MAVNWRKDYLRYKRYFLNVVDFYKQRPDVKSFLEVILSLAAISLLAVFAIRPTLLTIAELYKKIQAKEEVLVQMDKKIQDLDQARAIYEQERQRIDLLKYAVPDNPNPDNFTRQSEALVARNNASLAGFSIEEVVLSGSEEVFHQPVVDQVVPPEARSLPFSITLENDYSVLKNFISELETVRRPVLVDRISMQPPLVKVTDNLESTTVTLVISGQAPYIKIVEEGNR